MTKLTPRNLDHLVLPVPSLEIARTRLDALGFTVAPDARHLFGSENCCVYFNNGTYLEPLAIGHRETVEAAINKGNTFLRRDYGFRFRNGDNGFSAVCFTGADAKSEKRGFRHAGYQTGKIVTVKRPGLKVRAMFAMDERAPDITLFRCERPDGPPSFPDKLVNHPNGAIKIARVALYEDEPSDFQYYMQTISGVREVRSHSFGLDMELPNATLSALNESGMKTFYGVEDVPQGRGMRALAFDIEVSDLKHVAELLASNDIQSREISSRLVVTPDKGQGALLAFVESKA
ncbi:MAG: VOC family protein [Pseudomonadota bacterium]